MTRNHILLTALLFLAFAPLDLSRADDAQTATTESRLRDALRTTMLQLRDAQNQAATLQAAQAQSDKDNADLKTRIDALTSQLTAANLQSATDKDAATKTIADLNAKNVDLATQIAKLNDAVAAWEKDDKQYVQLAKDKEAARAQLAGQVILLQRLVDDRELKNTQLFNLGNEILTRYEKFGLGDALAAKEPFVGLSRVKLQNLVQDYKDKMLDQRVISGQPPTIPAVAPAPASTRQSPAPIRTAQDSSAGNAVR